MDLLGFADMTAISISEDLKDDISTVLRLGEVLKPLLLGANAECSFF